MLDINNLSAEMRDRVLKIADTAVPNVNIIKMTIYSDVDGEYRFTPLTIKTVIVHEDYESSYLPYRIAEIAVQAKDRIDILKHATGLRCNVKVYSTERGLQVADEPIYAFDSKCIIKDKADMLKQFPIGMFDLDSETPITESVEATLFPIWLEFIDDGAYELRKRKINTILRNVTVEQTIITLAQMLEFKKVHVVPPDNSTVYANMIIPPMKSISNLFNFLQDSDAYGVYDRGISHYVVNDTLYVYPIYNTNPESSIAFNIYNVGEGGLVGGDTYAVYEDGEMHVITNSGVDITDLLEEGLENIGNAYMSYDPNNVVDKWFTHSHGSITIAEDNIDTVDLITDGGMISEVYSPKFTTSRNLHKLRSSFASNLRELAALKWEFGFPGLITPVTLFQYHYDTTSGVTTQKGMCRSATYVYGEVPGIYDNVHACSVTLQLALQR